MKDEEALAKMTAAARDEQDALDPRWEKLAAGTATDAERAELEAIDADRYALYQPLDGGMRDAFTAAVLAELAREGAPASHTRARAESAAPAAGAKVISLEGRWRRRAMVAAVPLAAAAAAVLLFARGGETAAMPEYAATWASAERDLRGDPSAHVSNDAHVQASERFELVLRPAARVTASIVARPFIAHDGKREAWRAPMEVSDGGAVRIVGPTASLFPAGKGDYVIVIAIGAEGSLPTSADAAFDAVAPRAWRKVEGTIHVR
jgi:hypothetical protein